MIVATVAMALVGCRKPVEVSFANATVEVAAQGGSVDVTLKSNGDWTIDMMPEWVTVSPTSGTGDATLSLTALPNNTTEPRSGEVRASTKDNFASLTVTQGYESFIVVNPLSIESPASGGTFNVEISTNIDWAVQDMPTWVTCTPLEGSGSATIAVTVDALSDDLVAFREGDMVIGNNAVQGTVHVVQNADPVVLIEIEPNAIEMACTGETKSVMVTCNGAWTASTEADWVTLDKTQAEGDAEVMVTVNENPLYESRRASVVFTTSTGMNAVLMVRQEASPDPHFLEVSPHAFSFGKEGGQQELTIECDALWKIDVNSDWISASEQIGTGNATVTLTVEPNLLQEPRTLSFYVVSEPLMEMVTVSQEAGEEPVVLSLSPDTLSLPDTGSTSTLIEITSNTTWSLQASDWISNFPTGISQGNSSVYLIIDVNSSETPRYGFVRALHNGQVMDEIVVVQEGKPDLLETNITEYESRPEETVFTLHITANQAWVLQTDVMWLHVNPTSGFGNDDVTVTVDAMVSTQPREGHITIKAASGKIVVVTVTQHW